MSQEVTKVVGYLRVSSDQQANSWNGIGWQKWAIIEMANKLWFTIYKFYEDWGVSGKYMSRKHLDELLRDLKELNKNPAKPEIQYVMVDDIDRMARDITVRVTKKAEIEATGAKILSLKQSLDDTPEAHLMETISMATKQYERENNWRRVKDRQRQRMLDWFLCFKVPLGYEYWKAKNGHWKVVVPDENFPTISQWLKLLANGTLQTQEAFRKYLVDHWVRTRAWKPLQKSLISNLLKDENLRIYAGFVHRPEPWRDVDMVKGKHQAAITEAEFYLLANKLKFDWFYKEYSREDISEMLPLRQIMRCGYCGHRMSGWPANGHWWKYFYYTCFNRNCSHYKKSYNNNKVHKEVEDMLGTMELDDNYIDSIKVVLDTVRKEKWKLTDDLIKDKQKRLAEINKKIDDTVDKITETDNPLVYKKLEERVCQLTDEKELLEEDIARNTCGQDDDFMEHFEHLKSIIQTPLSVRNIWQLELKRMLINVIFSDGLTYTKEDWIQTSEIPLIYANNLKLCLEKKLWLKKSVQTSNTPVNNLYFNHLQREYNLMVGDIGLEPMTPCL